MSRNWLVGVLSGFALCLCISTDLGAQRGSGSRTRVQPKRRLAPAEFQEKFWSYLTKSRSAYRHWGSFSDQGSRVRAGKNPHGAFLKLYANQAARSRPQEPPHQSIFVLENYAADQRTLMAVEVMYRAKNFDPSHNDWYWIKYFPDGTVVSTSTEKGNKPIAGRFASCIACHRRAAGNDYVFAND
ncbi:MAG: hypothetical protein CMJ81_14855 [Planctomycetaceae bacterium]|nr:hypothetical protein [Planctomycetaceae bacterium]MBP63883.1 hypothetical protein [Planctomycetaceae bacterium]